MISFDILFYETRDIKGRATEESWDYDTVRYGRLKAIAEWDTQGNVKRKMLMSYNNGNKEKTFDYIGRSG